MSDLASNARALRSSLRDFKPTDHVGPIIGDMYNALLGEVQAELPEHALLRGLKPLVKDVTGGVRASAGDLRAVVDQILHALGESGPSIA
jgi:hypothetical protein